MLLIQALQDEGVLVVPGRGFGMPGYFRISYCGAAVCAGRAQRPASAPLSKGCGQPRWDCRW